jgi:hypothetical protein
VRPRRPFRSTDKGLGATLTESPGGDKALGKIEDPINAPSIRTCRIPMRNVSNNTRSDERTIVSEQHLIKETDGTMDAAL